MCMHKTQQIYDKLLSNFRSVWWSLIKMNIYIFETLSLRLTYVKHRNAKEGGFNLEILKLGWTEWKSCLVWIIWTLLSFISFCTVCLKRATNNWSKNCLKLNWDSITMCSVEPLQGRSTWKRLKATMIHLSKQKYKMINEA